jgi:hypothetical protein
MSKPFEIIDIGHRGLAIDEAISELEAKVSDCIFKGTARSIKIIHGHGSGALQRGVREWCKSYEGRFQGVIYGENYDVFDPLSALIAAVSGSKTS